MMKKLNKKGFTMAELLIVVAIIAVLVAIAIPIFTAQLEKSREATDAANLRSAYAEVMAAGLSEDTANYTKTVDATQKTEGWASSIDDIGGMKVGNTAGEIKGINSGSWTVTYNASSDTVSITPVN